MKTLFEQMRCRPETGRPVCVVDWSVVHPPGRHEGLEDAVAIAVLGDALYPICRRHLDYYFQHLRETTWRILPLTIHFEHAASAPVNPLACAKCGKTQPPWWRASVGEPLLCSECAGANA